MREPSNDTKSRAWQRMLSGRRLDLLEPAAKDIEIEDIAHGLARVARWNGQTRGAHIFSVAQHTLLVLAIFDHMRGEAAPACRLAALLHDAPEYVIGDLISPFKAAIGGEYKDIERRLLEAIHARFGLSMVPETTLRDIKAADRIAAYFEATSLAGFSIAEADEIFGRPPFVPGTHSTFEALTPVPAEDIERRFLAEFDAIASLHK